MSENPARVAIGKIGRPHGVRGEVRVFLFNPHSQTLEAGLAAYVARDGESPRALEIEKARYAAKFVIVKFAEIADRDQADELKHAHLEVDFEALPELDEGEFYFLELVGAPVYVADEEDGEAPEGEPIGVVDRFFETGANDVLVVRRDDDSELFAPVVEHAVSLLDLEAHRVVLQPLEIWTPEDA